MATAPAFGQSPSVNDQIRLLEKQINEQRETLKQQQEQLKALLEQTKAIQAEATKAQSDANAAQAKVDSAASAVAKAQAGTARAIMTPTNAVGWQSPDGRNEIQLHGRINYDIGIAGYKPDTSATPVRSLLTGTNMRRLELGFSARIEEDWGADMAYQLGTGGGDSFSDVKKGFVLAKLSYQGFKPLVIETGYQAPPFGLDDASGPENWIFNEYATAQQIANVAGGVGRGTPLLLKAGQGRWFATAALTTYLSGADHTVAAPWNVGARAAYHVWQSGDDYVQLGGNYQRILSPMQKLTLSTWPEYRLDMNKPLTQVLGSVANPVDKAETKGLEAVLSWDSLLVASEYFFLDTDQRNLGGNSFQGYYVEAAYVLTGERRHYNPNTAGYGKPLPLHPVSISRGGWGAWEVAARWGSMDLNDKWSRGTTNPLAVNGGRQDNFVLGVNWYPTFNTKFQLNWIHGGLYDRYSTARGNPSTGSKWNLFLLRSGFAF
jgi:phosphate-selective porin OprO and OprP